jgi:hypothetical protein
MRTSFYERDNTMTVQQKIEPYIIKAEPRPERYARERPGVCLAGPGKQSADSRAGT